MTITFFYFDKPKSWPLSCRKLCCYISKTTNPPPPPVDKKVAQRSINYLSSYTRHEYFKFLSGSGTCKASVPRPRLRNIKVPRMNDTKSTDIAATYRHGGHTKFNKIHTGTSRMHKLHPERPRTFLP